MSTTLPDVERVRSFLRAAGATPAGIERLEVSYLKAGADGAFEVLYEGAGPGDEVVRLAARPMAPAEGKKVAATLNRRHRARTRATDLPHAALYAPELGLLFQVFPADRGLPQLAAAVDAVTVAPLLARALARVAHRARLARVGVQVVRYKPGRKCLLRYDLVWEGGETSPPAVVYAKMARRDLRVRARVTLARMRRVGERLGFDVPVPLASVPQLTLEVVSCVPGVPLSTLAGSDRFPHLCRATADALRRFHAAPVALSWTWDAADNRARLARRVPKFAALVPAWADRLEAVADTLAARLTVRPAPRLRPIHHDFHGDNILVDGTRLGLVDFEDSALGDPADDVGSLWAQITWLASKPGARPDVALRGRQAFAEAYLTGAGASFVARAATHAALHCFLDAYQCLRHPRGRSRQGEAERLVAASEEVLVRGIG